MKAIEIAVVVGVVVLAVAYWMWPLSPEIEADPKVQPVVSLEPTQTPQQAAAQGDGTGVSENLILGISSSATLGTYLSAYNGMTVYTYNRDTQGVSNCIIRCASNWPPYTVPSRDAINVPANMTGKVDALTRDDGSLQVTYNGLPLYFYPQDKAPGDTTGHNINEAWFVVKP